MDEQFVPNFKKKLFEIKIEVYENALTFNITPKKGYQPRYFEVIGAAHTMLQTVIEDQSKASRQEYEKQQLEKGGN